MLARTLSFIVILFLFFLLFFSSYAFFMLSCLQLSHSCPHGGVPHEELELLEEKNDNTMCLNTL